MNKYLIENRVVFDDHLMMLFDADAKVELTTNETELLSILLQGTASKQAVIKQIWESKGIIVSEGSYHQLVRALRVKLGELQIDRNLIKTLPRLGLKFIGEVEQLAEPASGFAPERPARYPEPRHDAGASVDAPPSAAQPPADDELGNVARTAFTTFEATTLSDPPNLELTIVGITDAIDSGNPPSGLATAGVEANKAVKPIQTAALRRQIIYLTFCLALALWAGALAWLTFNHRGKRFDFHIERTIDGIHYFSNGRTNQATLLQSIGVVPPNNGFVYQIGLGSADWVAVCPKPIEQEAESCDSYFFQKSN